VKLELMLLHLAHAKPVSTARMRALLG